MEKFTFFWKQTDEYGFLSQWYLAPIIIDGVQYNCNEQYMMAEKARLFNDQETLEKIMAVTSPREQKKLGRLVKGFDKKIWEGKARDVIYKGNHAKLSQNPDLLEKLRPTIGTTLVEASPTDITWGIGVAEDDPKAKLRVTWPGTNWLGEMITKIRDELIATKE
jgi:ribA/ribD-fused uncharacterized protein